MVAEVVLDGQGLEQLHRCLTPNLSHNQRKLINQSGRGEGIRTDQLGRWEGIRTDQSGRWEGIRTDQSGRWGKGYGRMG